MGNFVHLHGHTEYSLLDGMSKIKKLIKSVKELGMPAVAITDHGSMYGVIEFYKECVKENIKPILGCEIYVAKRSHKDKEGKVDAEPYHLTVLAKNYQGYLNLMKLVSIGHLDGYYYRPRVDKALLKQYSEGLIALSGCPAGEFIRNVKVDFKDAQKVAEEHIKIFGEDNYFFELQSHEYQQILAKSPDLNQEIKRNLNQMAELEELSFNAVKDLSKKLGIKIVATNDFHYVSSDDAQAQDALVCVQTGKFISDIQRLRMIDTPNLYLRSQDEMSQLFSELPEAVGNTLDVADKIDLELKLGKPIFPIFDIPQNLTAMEHLRQICSDAFKQKFPDENEIYKDRLEYELGIIEQKNFGTYFLIVHDFIKWAHSHDIITNTRGSAAGSLVLYVLGVTNIDPVSYLLPFERFMNPLRPKLPDIDCDIADDRREEVIKYLSTKYGEDRVSNIVTFGTMMGRAAVRDIGRVLGMPYGEVDRIAKLVPPPHQGFHKALQDAIKEVPELSQMYKENPQIKSLLDLAVKVEGTVRHASVHAAGVVIAPDSLTHFAPLQRESNGDKIVSQYDMFSLTEDYEGVGLIKLDLLGIRNLSILGHATKIVESNGKRKVDLNNLPLDDKKTFELLGRGETMGLFQIEGEGITKYLVDLKPTNFFDIMAMIALYRPGPLASIPNYIARKHNPSKINYFDPRMREYMEQSLGLLVYQEDVLLTAINLAGYDWLEADKLRKAMGKKIPAEMLKEKEHFVEGCTKNGMNPEKAEELFKLIEPFAAYGFNKAHAASYAMVSYQTAYMKANFPVEFMAAVMTAESGDSDKITRAWDECKKLGILVLPPDINKSEIGFTLEDVKDSTYPQGIRFGFSAVKNVGAAATQPIIKARAKGEFKSLADLCSRVDTRTVNRKTIESLIKAGALDSLGSRAAQLLVLDQCLELAHLAAKKKSLGQVGLFETGDKSDEVVVKLPSVDELPLDQLLSFEKELLGFYLHEPPFLALINQASLYCSHKLSQVTEEIVGQKITFCGLITSVKRVVTKKSAAEMAFVTISDSISSIESVIFPKIFTEYRDILEADKVVIVYGKLDKREDKLSLLIDKLVEFNPATFDPTTLDLNTFNITTPKEDEKKKAKKISEEIEIAVPKDCGIDILRQVNKMLRDSPGKYKVALLLPNGGNNLKKMDLPFSIKMEPILIEQIEGLLGKGAVNLNPIKSGLT